MQEKIKKSSTAIQKLECVRVEKSQKNRIFPFQYTPKWKIYLSHNVNFAHDIFYSLYLNREHFFGVQTIDEYLEKNEEKKNTKSNYKKKILSPLCILEYFEIRAKFQFHFLRFFC